MKQLAEALAPALQQIQAEKYGVGYKHDASGTPTAGYLHGPGGVLSWPGVDQSVFHTVVGNRGILGQIPTKSSVFENPTFEVLTGVQADSGSEKSGVCDNAPYGGLKKVCMLTSVFGRYERATREIEINRIGRRNDRADPMDLTLIGSPIHQTGIFATGPQSPAAPADLLTREVSNLFWERNISMHRLLSQQLWAGNPANNAAAGGYKEMTGFQVLIATGHIDALTQQACPSIDSDVKNFGYQRIDVAGGGTAIVTALTAMYHYVKDLAERTGVLPVRWVFAMRPQLFYELTNVWPCSYLTYRCQLAGNQQLTIDGAEQIRMRDELRAGKFLMVDGERIEVVVDDGIPELDGNSSGGNFPAGCFASDIYLLPMSVIGGQASTYLEYFDQSNEQIAGIMGDRLVLGRTEGAFLTWPRQTNQCVVWQTKVEPRLVVRTPWLAGRLQNVVYCPAQHEREPFPTDPYFVDGGLTTRPGPSLWAPWGNVR